MQKKSDDTNAAHRAVSKRLRKESDQIAGKSLGKYRIGRELGRGGMGAVYLAEDSSLKRKVAIKVIRSPYGEETEMHERIIDRFRREAEASARISHPNVVTILEFTEVDGMPLQVMEYVDGSTLRQEIDGGKAIDPEDVVRIAISLLAGLEAIHQAGLIHRDIKPQNVMLTSVGKQVKLLDLGLVKFVEKDLPHDPTLTQAGMAMGSPTYMAPEQIGAKHVDRRADLYAVGVVLFQLLTGQAPFIGSQIEVFEQHRHKQMPKVLSPFGKLPKGLEAVIHKATEKDPNKRYQSADEMRAALEAIRFKPRRWLAAIALGLTAVAAAFITVIGVRSVADTQLPVIEPPPAVSVPQKTAKPEARQPIEAPVPPLRDVSPRPPVAKASDGCAAFDRGESSKAVEILGRVLAKKPNDAEALYCLCGAEARMPEKAAKARLTCEAFLRTPDQEKGKTKMVKIWLGRLR